MALTIGEANAVNTLLHYLFDEESIVGERVASDQAREAAALLADKAHKALMAGHIAESVRRAWPSLDAQLVAGIDEDAEPEDRLIVAMDDDGNDVYHDDVADHPFQGTERVPGYCKRCGCAPHIHPRAS